MSIERFLRALSEIMTAKAGVKATYRVEVADDTQEVSGNGS